MDPLPGGQTVHTCNQEADGSGLLKGGADTSANTYVHDLFHEDAQVRYLLCQLKYLRDSQ